MSSDTAAPTNTAPPKNCTCNNCHEPFARRALDSHFLCATCRTIPGVKGYRDPTKRGLESGSPAYWDGTLGQLRMVTDAGLVDGHGRLIESYATNGAERVDPTNASAPLQEPANGVPTESKHTESAPANEFAKWRAAVYSSPRLDDDVRLLLIRQADQADFLTGGNCFERQTTLAAALGVTVYEIRRRQAIAIEQGWMRLLPMVVGFRRSSSLIQFLRPAYAEGGPWEGPIIFSKRKGAKLAKSFKIPCLRGSTGTVQ